MIIQEQKEQKQVVIKHKAKIHATVCCVAMKLGCKLY